MSTENPDGTRRPKRVDRQAALCAVTPTPPPHLWLASIWWSAMQEIVSMAFDWPRTGPFLNGGAVRGLRPPPAGRSGSASGDAS